MFIWERIALIPPCILPAVTVMTTTGLEFMTVCGKQTVRFAKHSSNWPIRATVRRARLRLCRTLDHQLKTVGCRRRWREVSQWCVNGSQPSIQRINNITLIAIILLLTSQDNDFIEVVKILTRNFISLLHFTFIRGDTLLARQWIRYSQVVGLSPGWAPLCSGLRQATYTWVPLSPSSIIWYGPREWTLWLGKLPQAWWKVMAAYHRVYG